MTLLLRGSAALRVRGSRRVTHAAPPWRTDPRTQRKADTSIYIPKNLGKPEVSALTTDTCSRLKYRPICYQWPKGKGFTVIPSNDRNSLKEAKESPGWPEWEHAIQIEPE